MNDRGYTSAEIDEMREYVSLLLNPWMKSSGSPEAEAAPPSRYFKATPAEVEDRLRTYMQGGVRLRDLALRVAEQSSKYGVHQLTGVKT